MLYNNGVLRAMGQKATCCLFGGDLTNAGTGDDYPFKGTITNLVVYDVPTVVASLP